MSKGWSGACGLAEVCTAGLGFAGCIDAASFPVFLHWSTLSLFNKFPDRYNYFVFYEFLGGQGQFLPEYET